MKYLLLLSLLYLPLCHAEQVLRADYRERPPEMQPSIHSPSAR